jgi:RNA polymerase sigma factor (sigma-70 family)
MSEFEREFRKNFAEWYDRTYRYISCRLPSREASEDATAETFLQAWQKREAFDATRGEIPGWIIGIARHKIADYWRAKHPEPWDEEALERIMCAPKESLFDQVDASMAFDAIMNSLPQEAQALLTLRHVDDLPHEDIAEIIGKSPEAVRQSLSRLHKKLRTLFPHYELPTE